MEDNIDLQASSTTTCRTVVKFEHHEDRTDENGIMEKAATLNFRLLQLPMDTSNSKGFKMEPDTTLSDFGPSPIPSSLLPLSPLQPTTNLGHHQETIENNHTHNNIFSTSELDFQLMTAGSSSDVKSVSSASGILADLDQLRSDCEDEPMASTSCKKQRPRNGSRSVGQRRRSNSSTSTSSTKVNRIR